VNRDILTTIVVLLLAHATLADDEGLREALERSQQRLVRAQSQVQILRDKLINQALEIKAEVKEGEHQEGLEILDKKERLEQETKHQQDLRRWAVENFDNTRHGRLPEMNVGRRLKRLQKAKLLATRVLLEFPDLSRLAITNGRALNTFLEVCGKAALNHKQYAKEFAQLEREEHRVGGDRFLRRQDIEHLQFRKGPRKNAMAFDATRGALALDWPALLLLRDYAEHRRALEQAKQEALENLRKGHSIDPATQLRMLEAADRITELFNKEYREFHEAWKVGKYDAHGA